MALMITDACIAPRCDACEPECPNIAIYPGHQSYELFGEECPAISDNHFYIVPGKCTECVGFHEQPACIAVCPVDCCVHDPNYPETKEELLVKKDFLERDKVIMERIKEIKERKAQQAQQNQQ